MMNNIEFIEETHTYLKDGVIIPSVSEILHFIFPKKYENIPQFILNNKANYGTKVHESIELFEINKDFMQEEENIEVVSISNELNYIQIESIKQYIKLKKENDIEVVKQEQMINYQNKYCGRFDMIANIKNKICLCDIKTTAQLDKKYLSYQLSFYELAYGQEFDKLYAIWLPKKDLGRLVEIERIPKEELLKILDEFEKEKIDESSSINWKNN